jgi:hypothetical protein
LFADHYPPRQEEYTLDLTRESRPIGPGKLRLGGSNAQGETLAFTSYYLTRNGRPLIPVMGEFHFSRFPHQYWEEELRKMQAGGVTIVATYVFWIHVEEEEGVFDWSGNNDLRAFLEACRAVQMPVLLRIGPFDHGECRNGGLPDWLYARGIQVRSNDKRYLAYVRRLYEQISAQVQGHLFEEGGVVLGIQLDNEYMHCGAPWEVPYRAGSEWIPAGSDGEAHMLALKQLAQEVGLRAPLYTCTGWIGSPVPEGEFLPMQGGYPFQPWSPDPDFRQEPTREFLFRDRHVQPLPEGEATYDAPEYPYVSCELGGGIQITYHHRPTVPPECVQAQAIVALGSGANLLGYYMYHGGSHPVGKHSYLNEYTVPRISYDFQAPVREFGQLNASYHRLRALHLFLQDFGEQLAPLMVFLPESSAHLEPRTLETLRYAARFRDGAGFLFLNNYQDHVDLPDQTGVSVRLDLPGESLTIPHSPQGLTLLQGVSAILPFNLDLGAGVLLKYATAQLLTKVQAGAETTLVFFAPEGMTAEFALARASYRSLEISGGELLEDDARGYIHAGIGQTCRVDITALDGTLLHLLVLTTEQALTCWKVDLWGAERLLFCEALPLVKDGQLRLSWRGAATTELAFYPPLSGELVPGEIGHGSAERARPDELFTRYQVSVPEHSIEFALEHESSTLLRLELPADALAGIDDAYLIIDYLGDVGHAYQNGRLIHDHFANGLPWEIGLKRFVIPGEKCELILRISPLKSDAAALSYFPTGMTFRPVVDGNAVSEVRSITVLPAYHLTLARRFEQTALGTGL